MGSEPELEESRHLRRDELPPPDFFDPVIEAYKRNVDRTLLREKLKLTTAQRAEKFRRAMRLCFELRRAGRQGKRIF